MRLNGEIAKAPSTTTTRFRRRVLHIVTVPGSLMFLQGQCQYMRERGYDYVVVCSPGPGLEEFARDEDVEVHAIEMPRAITPLDDLRAVARLAALIRRVRPDIVHAHTPKGGLLGMIAAAAVFAPNRIYQMHGLPLLTARGWKLGLLTQTERLSCVLAHHVICVSESLRDEARRRRLGPRGRLTVIGPGSTQGVDCVRFQPPSPEQRATARAAFGVSEDATVFGFVGRLVVDKGIAELAEAWQRIRAESPDAILLLVGGRDTRDAAPESMLQALERDPRVRAVGFTQDMPSCYAAMDALVLPTYREGFPNVPLEAAAMGLAVIATHSIGCVDAVVDGQTGLLVPPRDAIALGEAMRTYLKQPALRAAHGANGRERVATIYRRERIWALIAEDYDRVLGEAS